MQSTSALWKRLWASGNARLETVAVIAGREYAQISNPVITRALMQGGLDVGNAVAATCFFSVRGVSSAIPRSAQVVLRSRLTDGSETSEWLPMGTYYVSHRAKDAVTGVMTLTCYDAMLKANADLPESTGWPHSMAQLAATIAQAMGLTLDGRSSIRTGDSYMVDKPEDGTTMHDVLARIAAYNGGNWIVTPDGKLRLVKLTSAANAAGATSDVAEVVGVVSRIDTGAGSTITGLRCEVDGESFMTGDDTGLVLDLDVTVPVLMDLSEWMLGMTYQAFSLSGAVYDPAAELGDYVRAGANGEIRAVLNSETATLGLAFRGDIASPETGEMADEYP